MAGKNHTPGSSDTQVHMDNGQHTTQIHRDGEKHSDEPLYAQSPDILARLEHFTWVCAPRLPHPLRSLHSPARGILPIIYLRMGLQKSDADNYS